MNYHSLNLKELKARREKYRTKLFAFLIEIALTFSIPAFLSAYIGRKLDKAWGTGNEATIPLLVFTFVISWVIVLTRYHYVTRRLHRINEVIKEKEEAHN